MPNLLSFCTKGCLHLIMYRFSQGQERSSRGNLLSEVKFSEPAIT